MGTVNIKCGHCNKTREITVDYLKRVDRGVYRNLCRSCSKRLDGGLSVAAREKTMFRCPECGKGREITGWNLILINKGVITGRCRSCAQKGHSGYTRGLKHSKETLEKMRMPKPWQAGELNYFWQGGVSFEPYTPEFNATLKKRGRKRDGCVCQECHHTQEQLGYKLHVHHIDYDKKNNKEENLVSLCRSCHSQTNFGREDWTNYFQKQP